MTVQERPSETGWDWAQFTSRDEASILEQRQSDSAIVDAYLGELDSANAGPGTAYRSHLIGHIASSIRLGTFSENPQEEQRLIREVEERTGVKIQITE